MDSLLEDVQPVTPPAELELERAVMGRETALVLAQIQERPQLWKA